MEKICGILENLEKSFFLRKKIHFNFSKSGVFWGKKMFRKFFETSVIISLKEGDSRYFSKKFQKLFKWTKIQLQVSKSGVFWRKKKTKIRIGCRHFFENKNSKSPLVAGT